jgi:uncharacterized protein YbaP (TraB family)
MKLRRVAAPLAAVLAALSLAQTVAAAQTFLWRVTGKQGSAYLLGSVHMLSKDYYPLDPALDAAFQESTLLVEEVDFEEMLGPEAALQMLKRGLLPAGQSLEQRVSPETWALVTKSATALGLPIGPLGQFKPWMAAFTLLGLEWRQAGLDAELGIDKHFFDRAKAGGKPVQGLETLDYQVRRFDEMPDSEQDLMLSEALKGLSTEMANIKLLADAWRVGDAPTVEAIVLKDLKAEPQMYERLLVERNRNWLPKIEALLGQPGRAFIVVGAAHLVGPDGLVAMLKARGYTVEQQ